MGQPALLGDLHVHTRCSDGSYTVEGALDEAARRGLGFVSLVDHDTTAGVEYAARAGSKYGVRAIPGVEISAWDRERGREVHLLGYCFDRSRGNIDTLCDPIGRSRHEMTIRQIAILSRAGYPVDIASVEAAASAGLSEAERKIWPGILFKQHIMLVLIERGCTDSIYGPLYRELFKGDGICAMEIEHVDVFDALAAIKSDGGIAVLAHPGQQNTWHLVASLAKEGLGGIELYHPDHGPKDHSRAMRYAGEYGLVLTGGSDDHGVFDSSHPMGDVRAPYGAMEALYERSEVQTLTRAASFTPVTDAVGHAHVPSRAWDWSAMDGPEWNTVSEEFLPVAMDWITDEPATVLDYGCGVGRHALWLAEHGMRVTAVDLSPTGIEKLRSTAVEHGLEERITAVVSDMVTADLRRASFDHAVAYHSIYHSDIAGLEKALQIVRRSLRDGGEFFVTFLSKRSPAFEQPGDIRVDERTYVRGSGSEIGIPHTFLDYEDILSLMCGFRILKAQQIEDISVDGRKRAWHYFIRAVAE